MVKIYNFLEKELHPDCIHGGEGLCPHANIIPGEDFEAPVRFLNYTVLPEGASFGLHTHGNDNELYIVLEGEGHYTCNGETVPVHAGDILKNPPYGTHAIANDSASGVPMRLLVLESFVPSAD